MSNTGLVIFSIRTRMGTRTDTARLSVSCGLEGRKSQEVTSVLLDFRSTEVFGSTEKYREVQKYAYSPLENPLGKNEGMRYFSYKSKLMKCSEEMIIRHRTIPYDRNRIDRQETQRSTTEFMFSRCSDVANEQSNI
jgi:hypothetical protein